MAFLVNSLCFFEQFLNIWINSSWELLFEVRFICLANSLISIVRGLKVSVRPCLKAAVLHDSYVGAKLPCSRWWAIWIASCITESGAIPTFLQSALPNPSRMKYLNDKRDFCEFNFEYKFNKMLKIRSLIWPFELFYKIEYRNKLYIFLI